MPTGRDRGKKTAFSIVEAMIAISILAAVLLIAVAFLSDSRRVTNMAQEKAFAIQKAISLVEEVRMQSQSAGDAADLDVLNDGDSFNQILSLQNTPSADVEPSGNLGDIKSPTGWHYSRRIEVVPPSFGDANMRDLRLVRALVYRNERDGSHPLLADVAIVLRTPGKAFPTSQAYDVYLLAIENIPGWWVYMNYLRPLMDSTMTDLQARNPGLVFKAHWITKSGYGRNPVYTPYINEAQDSTADVNWVYYYPGTMPAGQDATEYYVPGEIKARMNVDDTLIRCDYNRDTQAKEFNPLPYNLADEWNHGMRFIDEVRYFNRRVAWNTKYANASLDQADAPTWHMLLERMCSRPADYENAILINLHGELLPMPAVRNYSDAAKEPETLPFIRAVTHPQQLCAPANQPVKLRVYAYRSNAGAATAERLNDVTVVIKNVNLTGNVNGGASSTLNVSCIEGGLAGVDYSLVANPPQGAGATMWFQAAAILDRRTNTTDTVLYLHNTPVLCPQIVGGATGKGLGNSWRLYGLDYIPSSVETAGDFSRNLTTAGNFPKNTARWIIEIPAAMRANAQVQTELATPHDGVTEVTNRLTLETSIGAVNPGTGNSDPLPGTRWYEEPDAPYLNGTKTLPAASDSFQPENFSRTYIWWTDQPASFVPWTERSQFIGDPRHSPYSDLKDGSTYTTFRNHYNWYFDNFNNAANGNQSASWPGYNLTDIQNATTAADGWSNMRYRWDVPRYLELLRTALQGTDSLWTTLTGFSYFYMGIGNEIGYDAANGSTFSVGVPVSRKPYNGSSGARTEQMMVTGSDPADASTIGIGTKYIIRGTSASMDWWGMPWIGELYPDRDPGGAAATNSWTKWKTSGNLPTGNSSSTFLRMRPDLISTRLPATFPLGTSFENFQASPPAYSMRRMAEVGCNSFFLAGPSRSSTFYHEYNDSNGTLQPAGVEIANRFAFPLPTQARINRPFRADWAGHSWTSNQEFTATADYPHSTAKIVRVFYDHPWSSPNGMGAALLAFNNPAGTHSLFAAVNGISMTIESGSAFISRWSLLTLIEGFLTAGEPATAALPATRIIQLPRVEIKSPTIRTELGNPTTVPFRWSTTWLAWNGEPYTQYYPSNFTEDMSNIRYVLMYSKDNGQTWYYMESSSATEPVQATPGVRPPLSSPYLVQDLNASADETFQWSVEPAEDFPEGVYLMRVEAYRLNRILHYSYHMERAFIQRS